MRDTVIVRAYRGEPLARRVWEATPEAVYICTEERFQMLEARMRVWPATGFPREDVFVYDPALLEELQAHWQTDPSVWDRATPYTDITQQEKE
jgi:hypothetical protein